MEFWQTYYTESLQTPWRLETLVEPGQVEARETFFVEEPENAKVFAFLPTTNNDCLDMLKRMVLALKYSANEVTFLPIDSEQFESLHYWQSAKKILCFGESFPGQFGDFINWYGHKVMKTHSLENLQSQASLKKATWDHLKVYASLK